MHSHAGHGQVVGDDLGEHAVQRGALLLVQRDAPVLGDVPVGEQRQLALQHGCIVDGQHTGLGRQLQGDQRINGLVEQRCGILWRVALQYVQHGLGAQVTQQHEARRLVPGQHLGHTQAGLCHQRGDTHKGLTVFLVGRGVHHDAAAVDGIEPEITPKTRVGSGQAQAAGVELVVSGHPGEPALEGGFAGRVGPDDGAGCGRCGGCTVGHNGGGREIGWAHG